ncbi:glycosyltransferase family 2 protein [Leptobacterium sp. I13]|uniref:glycosyltransferase family 2 protein n=1 Tax=Leptobacterium meishanense TaxID=3128904 RepID=UPI0030EE39F8
MEDMVLELLVATMDREDLKFLYDMFPFGLPNNLKVLIINQTSKDKLLVSSDENIRVINSYEKGLSKSRNLAIQNAIGDICLIADDDVKYKKEFQKIILDAFNDLVETSIIAFMVDTNEGRPYKKYYSKKKQLKKIKEIDHLSSVEIAFRHRAIISNNIFFNEAFGLRSTFLSGEETLFVLEALKKQLKIYFVPRYIVLHSFFRSTTDMGSDAFIKAKSAIKYIQYRECSRVWLIKFIFFLWRKGYIKMKEAISKYFVGLKAINQIRQHESSH